MVVQNLLRCLGVGMVLVQNKTEFIELVHITIAVIESSMQTEGLQEIREGQEARGKRGSTPRHGGGSRPYLLV